MQLYLFSSHAMLDIFSVVIACELYSLGSWLGDAPYNWHI
jgi:hypothetical protein